MLLLTAVLAAGVCFDLATFRIPNRLIITGYILGIGFRIINALTNSPPDGVASLLLIAAGDAFISFLSLWILMPFFKAGIFGGGDIKLISIIILFEGPLGAFNSFFCALVCCASLAGPYLLLQKAGLLKLPELKKRGRLHVVHFSVFLLLGVIIEYFIKGLIRPY